MTDNGEIGSDCLAVIKGLSGAKADLYVGEILLPAFRKSMHAEALSLSDLRSQLHDPYLCLFSIYSHYAFSRRGKERFDLSQLAGEALTSVSNSGKLDTFLLDESAQALWDSFVRLCLVAGRKPMPQINCGVVAGLAELAQELKQSGQSGSIASWVVDMAKRTGRIEDQFARIVDVRGVGPKLASLFLRDIVFIYDLEEYIDPIDRILIVPIDKWTRILAPHIIDEPVNENTADWILAGKISKYARKAGASSCRLTMGTTYFGSKELKIDTPLSDSLRQLITNPSITLR